MSIVLPDMFEIMIKMAIKYPDYGILSPLHLSGSGIQFDSRFFRYLLNGSPEFVHDLIKRQSLKQIYPLYFVNAAFWLLSRECLEKVGGFNPIFFHRGEDDDYCNRTLYSGLKIGICPAAVGLHFRENRTEHSTYSNCIALRRKEIIVDLKNPYRKFNSVFISILYRNLIVSLLSLIRFQFKIFLIHLELIVFMLRNYWKIKRSSGRGFSSEGNK